MARKAGRAPKPPAPEADDAPVPVAVAEAVDSMPPRAPGKAKRSGGAASDSKASKKQRVGKGKDDLWEVEKVLQRRELNGEVAYKVSWAGSYDDTWEPLESFAEGAARSEALALDSAVQQEEDSQALDAARLLASKAEEETVEEEEKRAQEQMMSLQAAVTEDECDMPLLPAGAGAGGDQDEAVAKMGVHACVGRGYIAAMQECMAERIRTALEPDIGTRSSRAGRFQKDKSLMVVRGFSAVPYEFVHYEIAKHAAVVDMTKYTVKATFNTLSGLVACFDQNVRMIARDERQFDKEYANRQKNAKKGKQAEAEQAPASSVCVSDPGPVIGHFVPTPLGRVLKEEFEPVTSFPGTKAAAGASVSIVGTEVCVLHVDRVGMALVYSPARDAVYKCAKACIDIATPVCFTYSKRFKTLDLTFEGVRLLPSQLLALVQLFAS